MASPGLIEALAEEEVLLLRLRPIIRLIGLSMSRPEKKLRLDPLGSRKNSPEEHPNSSLSVFLANLELVRMFMIVKLVNVR